MLELDAASGEEPEELNEETGADEEFAEEDGFLEEDGEDLDLADLDLESLRARVQAEASTPEGRFDEMIAAVMSDVMTAEMIEAISSAAGRWLSRPSTSICVAAAADSRS